jgi:hypothetical protein
MKSGGRMHTVFEARDRYVQVVEDGEAVFLDQSVEVYVLIFHVGFAYGMDPFGLENVYVWSLFCGMSAFGGVDVADYQMCHVGGEVETVNGTHASCKIVELVLSRRAHEYI